MSDKINNDARELNVAIFRLLLEMHDAGNAAAARVAVDVTLLEGGKMYGKRIKIEERPGAYVPQ